MSWLDDVRKVFDKYQIPDYIWLAIMACESGGDPKARNGTGEESRGLFQINIKANPKYAGLDLYDPVVNAEVAARDFIAPAYRKAKDEGMEDPLEYAEYVWRYGIQPYWDEAHKRTIRKYAEQVLKGNFKLPAEQNAAK